MSVVLHVLCGSGDTIEPGVLACLTEAGYSVLVHDQVDSVARDIRRGFGDAVLLWMTDPTTAQAVTLEVRGVSACPIVLVDHPENQDRAFDLLALGASDLVCRAVTTANPLSIKELISRLAAQLRRVPFLDRRLSKSAMLADVVVDRDRPQAWRGGHPLALTAKEHKLLLVLFEAPNTLVAPEELLRRVWSADQQANRTYLRTYVSRLRKKLGWTLGRGHGPRLVAVRDVGYGAFTGAEAVPVG